MEIVKKPEPSKVALSNCWRFVKEVYIPNMPSTATIKAGMTKKYGDIAVFYYPNSGLWHYAKTIERTDTTFTIDETNYRSGTRTQRTLLFTDPRLKGFYTMPQ